MVVPTHSDSACTSPEDDGDSSYASDHAVSPVEGGASDTEMLIEKPLSGLRKCVTYLQSLTLSCI